MPPYRIHPLLFVCGLFLFAGLAGSTETGIYQETTNYLPIPEAARPLDALLPPKGLAGKAALLETNSQYLKREHRVNFDTRQVEIVSYVRVPIPPGVGISGGSGGAGGSDSGGTKGNAGVTPRWSSYYNEVDAYSQDMQSLALRRGWLSSLIGKEEGVEGGNPGTFIFDLPFRVPDWMKRVGVDKPKLTINGSYKLIVAGSRQSGSGAAYGGKNWFPDLHMEQQPQFSVKGSIGRLINIEINSEEGFGTNLKEQMKITYKGEGDELEDDIIQEIEAGNTSLALTGTSLTGYTENHKGIFGLKMRMKFGPIEATVIGSQEGGAQEKQSLGSSNEFREFAVEDKSMELHKHFFLNLADLENYKDTLQWRLRNAPYVTNSPTNRKPIDVYQKLFGTEEPNNRDTALACVYDKFGVITEYCDLGRWKLLKEGDDFSYDAPLRMLTIPGGGPDMTYAVRWEKDFINPNGGARSKNKLILIHSKDLKTNPLLDPLIWRNVYFIGSTDEKDRNNFTIRVINGDSSSSGSEPTDSITYARQLGLEKPDRKGEIDYDNTQIFNFNKHYMVLPCYSSGIAGGDLKNCLEPLKRVNKETDIYTSKLDDIQNLPTVYRFLVKSREHKSTFDVRENSQTVNGQQCFDITPGTEVVSNGSTRLVKNVDYEVLYETGQITLISPQARSPGANITVSYECTPAFEIQNKILLGTRLEWKLDEISDQSLLGATFLYKSQSVQESRPEIGHEPFNQMLWGFNARLAGEPKWMTKAVNLVPLVKTEVASKANFEFEVAQSRFNPNTKSSASVEDFENSQSSYGLPLSITNWKKASPPDLDNASKLNANLDYRHQGPLVWHSSTKENYWRIYGSTGSTYIDSREQTLLSLKFTPNDNLDGNSWGGIMQGFSGGLNNQSKKRTLDLVVWGQKGTLSVDLGEISEDISIPALNNGKPDGSLESEINILKGELVNKDDAGLDGLLDTKGETEGVRWECKPECYPIRLDGVYENDPGMDTWKTPTAGTTDETAAVNGTEGNNRPQGTPGFDTEDLDRSGSLEVKNRYLRFNVPLDSGCSEINHCESLSNGWRRFLIPLYGGGIKIDPGNTTNESGILSNVRLLRLWLNKVPQRVSEMNVKVARLALVGNTWEEGARNQEYQVEGESFTSGDLAEISDSLSVRLKPQVADNNNLKVDIVNKQEMPEYKQSPNTPRERDISTDAPKPERSLVLNYENLHPGETVFATRLLGSDPKDFTSYDRMLLEIHPDVRYARGAPGAIAGQNRIAVGLRLGKDLGNRDSRDYYEIKLHMDSAANYDPDHIDIWNKNSFVINLSDLTRLKNDPRYLASQTTLVAKKMYHPQRQDSSLTISVIGNPTLARIDWMQLVVYVDSGAGQRQSGNIWVNDLRVEGVDRSTGTAMRSRVQFNFADFITLSGDMNYTNGNFTSMSQTKATPANSVSKVDFNTAFSMSAGKFFPDPWAISIPIDLAYRGSLDRPFVKPSSDLELNGTGLSDITSDLFAGKLSSVHDHSGTDGGDSLADINRAYARVYQTVNFEKTFGISYKKDHRSDSWFTQTLFERPEIEYKYRNNQHLAYYDENYARNYTSRLRYNLSPFSNKSYKPFSAGDSSKWVPKFVAGFEITPLPDKLNLTLGDLNFNRTLEVKKPRNPQELVFRDSAKYQVDLAHGLDLEWRLVPSVSFGYRLEIKRTFDREHACFTDGAFFAGESSPCDGGLFASNLIFDWENDSSSYSSDSSQHYSENFLILNREKNRNQTFHFDYNPSLIAWLTTGFAFNSGYSHTWYETPSGSAQPSYFDAKTDHSVKLSSGLNLPNLMTSLGSLGSKGFADKMEKIKRKLDDYRLRTFDVTFNVSHKYNNENYSYYKLVDVYKDVGAGQFYADQLGWRYDLFNLATLFDGEPDPYRMDYLMAPDPRLTTNTTGFLHQVDRSLDLGSGFTVPGVNLDLYGNLKWSKSYILYRELTPSDTSVSWPEYSITASLGDFASKLPYLRTHFRTVTASSSYNFKHENKFGQFSQSSETDLRSYKFTPLLRLSGTTNKDVRIENSFNVSFDDEVRYSKTDGGKAPFLWYKGVDSLTTYVRVDSLSQPVSRFNVGNDFSISKDVETQKGIQFWRYYIKLKNNLRLKLTQGFTYTLVEEKKLEGENPRTTDLVTFTLKPDASYNFTNNIDALFFVLYQFRKDFKVAKQETTHDVTVHGEFTMRF